MHQIDTVTTRVHPPALRLTLLYRPLFYCFGDDTDHNVTGLSGIDSFDPTGETAQTIGQTFRDEETAGNVLAQKKESWCV
jgi:hypothetical protein